MDELRLGLDESDDAGWDWLELDVPQVKVPFVRDLVPSGNSDLGRMIIK